jgi:predicted nucleic acid-binding Zn ribbon protein
VQKKTNDAPIKDVLKWMVQQYSLQPKLREYRIASVWNKLMGQAIANYTRDIQLSKNGVLLLYINSAPLKQELSLAKEKIMQLLNQELGEEAVKEVLIR